MYWVVLVLYVFKPLSDILFIDNSYHSVGCLFILLIYFSMQKKKWKIFCVQVLEKNNIVKMPMLPKEREGNGSPLQYTCLENSMVEEPDEQATVQGATKSQTQLSDFTVTQRNL